MAVISIPTALRERLGESATDALIEVLDKVEDRSHIRALETMEERFERRLTEVKSELKIEISGVKADLKTEIANLGGQLRTEIANTKSELRTEIANTRANLIKWMFIFWVGQIGTITAILFAFFNFFKR